MCGIAGYFGGDPLPGTNLRLALDKLFPRGPDMSGVVGWTKDGKFCPPEKSYCAYDGWEIALLHTRLSIIDLSDAGKQPMTNADGRWIVFNGEIYNYREIRDELSLNGYEFHTRTDTEVILAAYSKWGYDCVSKFNGMWSFAIYDPARKIVFCSRDRLGVKPFHFTRTKSGGFAFASEIPALLALVGASAQINPARLASYIVSGATDDGPETLYSGIRELRGARNGIFDLRNNSWTECQYWSLPNSPDFEGSEEEALEVFEDIFESAVRLRLHADVPVALLLSGGVDSSAIALAIQRVGGKVMSVTSSFPDYPEIDETGYAAIAAKSCGLPHKLVQPNISDAVSCEPLLTKAQASPYGSLSLYVHWAILRSIKENRIPVVLSGQGGDELFFGYERYYANYWRSHWPSFMKMYAVGAEMSRNSGLGRFKSLQYLLYFGVDGLQWQLRKLRASSAFKRQLIDAAYEVPDSILKTRAGLQSTELTQATLPRLLRYDDRTSGSLAVETRLPFLDYRLVQFAYALPWKTNINGGWTKYLLRKYLDRHGLKINAWRKQKLGFNAPTSKWISDLYRAYWEGNSCTDFARKILKNNITASKLHHSVLWDMYNITHLARIHDWHVDF